MFKLEHQTKYCPMSSGGLLTLFFRNQLLSLTRPHNSVTGKSAKAGKSAERGNASHTRNHQELAHWDPEVQARPPTNANQTESGAGQRLLQCRRKSPQPTPRSCERHKGMHTGPGQVLDGSSRGFNTTNMPADRAQANQRKVPKSIPASLRDTRSCQKTCKSSIENGQHKTESEIKLLIQENSKQQDRILYIDGSVTKDQSGWGFTVKQSATTIHEKSAVTHALRWVASSSQTQWACYRKWKVEWEVQTGMCRWSTSIFENSCGCRLASRATLTNGLLEDLKCWEAWDTTCGHKAKDITPLIAWRREALKEEALDDLPWKDERGPSSVRRTLEPFQRHRWGNFGETGWSAYGLFRAHRYHLELNWTELKWTSSHHTHHSSCLVCLFTILTYVGKYYWTTLEYHTPEG